MSYLSRIAESYQKQTLSRKELAYYARHILLPSIGLDGQRKLKTAKVLVVGAGGLGCPALQALAGAGVGHVTIADGDEVSISNLSRQWLHSAEDCGWNKASSAKAAVKTLNPFIEVETCEAMLTKDNAERLISTVDIVVDATDDLDVRYIIDEVCAAHDLPWVHAALYRENSQMTVFWKRYGATFAKLFPNPSAAPSCAGAGILGASASIIGNLQALEVVKLITGNGKLSLGELVSVNTNSLQIQRFNLPDVLPAKAIKDKRTAASSQRLLTVSDLTQALSIHEPLTIIDLRKDASKLADRSIYMSEEDLMNAGVPEDMTGKIVLVCEEGLISSILAEALSTYREDLYYLEGGAQAMDSMV